MKTGVIYIPKPKNRKPLPTRDDILSYAQAGKTIADIAEEWDVHENTISEHLKEHFPTYVKLASGYRRMLRNAVKTDTLWERVNKYKWNQLDDYEQGMVKDSWPPSAWLWKGKSVRSVSKMHPMYGRDVWLINAYTYLFNGATKMVDDVYLARNLEHNFSTSDTSYFKLITGFDVTKEDLYYGRKVIERLRSRSSWRGKNYGKTRKYTKPQEKI